jgi:glycosyltransferase involved in cell wall biosynthesis
MAALPSLARPPRICFVGLDNLPVLAREYNHHYIGGEPVQQTLLAREFAGRGYDVSMVVADYGQADEAEWHGIRTFKAYPLTAGIPVVRYVHPRWTGLWSALKRADADVYYTSCAGAQVGQIAMFCQRYGRKLIFRTAHDTDCEPDRLLIKYWRDKKLYSYGLRKADAVLTQSVKQCERMRANFGVESTIAGMLVDYGDVLPLRERTIDLLWVANLRMFKRPDLFLDVCEHLPQYRAHMIGGPVRSEAALYDTMQARASALPHVTFHGRVAYHDAGALYERARLLVNTSDSEGFPNTYLQAWSRGVPVVAFFDPDNVIAKEGLGRAVQTLGEMEAAIAELAANDVAWQAASTRCRDFMQREFGADTVIAPYADAVNRLCESSRAR